MERIGGRFIDCQFETPLFKSMGGRHITYEEYMRIMGNSLDAEASDMEY
jgi:leucyl/phenylalanyl-tRNA--protein transferase